MNKIIEVKNFVKSYGSFKAVKDISFYVEEGQLFSFLGPNGAGKSTTIDALCTLTDFNSGGVTINGHDLRKNPKAIREDIGVVFQDSILDSLLTVEENLHIRAGLYSKNKKEIKAMVDDAAKITMLADFFKRPYGKLSGGQRRRADVACALLHKPKILFLDEPTTGLDPQTRLIMWETIKKLQSDSKMTVFLTTHYMEEAAESDYIVVINQGEIAAKGTVDEMKTQFASDTLRIVPSDIAALIKCLESFKIDYTTVANEVRIKLDCTIDSIPILYVCKQYIKSYQTIQGTMDDAFIGIIGREIS